jgi:hypothetical protein
MLNMFQGAYAYAEHKLTKGHTEHTLQKQNGAHQPQLLPQIFFGVHGPYVAFPDRLW